MTTDAEKIADPSSWPMKFKLPMKRRTATGGLELGCITADFPTIVLREYPTTKGILLQVWIESTEEELEELGMFKPPPIPDEMRAMYEEGVTHRYETIESMLADGWVID